MKDSAPTPEPREASSRKPARRDGRLQLPPMSRGMRWFSAVVIALGLLAVVIFLLLNPLNLSLPREAATAEPGAAVAVASSGDNGDMQIYQCPMHPEVLRKEPGTCPICAMTLVAATSSRGSSSPFPSRSASAKIASASARQAIGRWDTS